MKWWTLKTHYLRHKCEQLKKEKGKTKTILKAEQSLGEMHFLRYLNFPYLSSIF